MILETGRLAPTHPPAAVAVVVPAHNEEFHVERCLRAIEVARRATQDQRRVRWWTVVVADSCTDTTAGIAARLLGRNGEVLVVSAANVGRARRLGTARAFERFVGLSSDKLWLASTDADSAVPPTWVLDQLVHADVGADAVAGIVAVDHYDEHPPEGPERFQASYEISAHRSHGHVHGANLAVRASSYVAAGGWSDLALSEDHDLWGRLRANGATCVSSTSLVVITSGRRQGRAPGGFAHALRVVCDGGAMPAAGVLTARTAS